MFVKALKRTGFLKLHFMDTEVSWAKNEMGWKELHPKSTELGNFDKVTHGL